MPSHSEEMVASNGLVYVYLVAHYEPASGVFSIRSSYIKYTSNFAIVLDSYPLKNVCCCHMYNNLSSNF